MLEIQRVGGGLGQVFGSAQEAVLSLLTQVHVGPGGGFVKEEAFGIQDWFPK